MIKVYIMPAMQGQAQQTWSKPLKSPPNLVLAHALVIEARVHHFGREAHGPIVHLKTVQLPEGVEHVVESLTIYLHLPDCRHNVGSREP